MKTLRTNWKKIILISAVCTVFDVVIHLWVPIYEYNPPSFFIKNKIFEPAAAVALFLTFVLMGIIFTLIQERLPGKKIQKGLRYAIAFGGLWLLAVIGMSLFLNSPFTYELTIGGLDFLAIVLFGLLLGKYTASDNMSYSARKPKQIIGLILTITLTYFVGRYLAFVIFNIELPYSTKLTETILWTFGIGFFMGLTYLLLKQSVKNYSSFKKAISFGGLLFGIFWLFLNFFALLFVDMPLSPLLLLVGSDIMLFIIGIWVFEVYVGREKNFNPNSGF